MGSLRKLLTEIQSKFCGCYPVSEAIGVLIFKKRRRGDTNWIGIFLRLFASKAEEGTVRDKLGGDASVFSVSFLVSVCSVLLAFFLSFCLAFSFSISFAFPFSSAFSFSFSFAFSFTFSSISLSASVSDSVSLSLSLSLSFSLMFLCLSSSLVVLFLLLPPLHAFSLLCLSLSHDDQYDNHDLRIGTTFP